MTVECWFADPKYYLRELAEARQFNFIYQWNQIWDCDKSQRYLESHIGRDAEYRMLIVGKQGTVELRRDSSIEYPTAVYPTWVYGESLAKLEDCFMHNVGASEEACNAQVWTDQKPIFGQEHRVVASYLPKKGVSSRIAIVKVFRELQQEYPDVMFLPYGLRSWQESFGSGLRAASVDPYIAARYGDIILPSGKRITVAGKWESEHLKWIHLLGFKTGDLKVPRNRCLFNIKSALWAAEHFMENMEFRVQGEAPVDADAIDFQLPQVKGKKRRIVKDGDKILCDLCSLQKDCKHYRHEGVCSIPDSEVAGLAAMFKTRDSNQIIQALGELLAASARRLEDGLETEEAVGGSETSGLDPEVTKLVNSLFDRAVVLAKLVDPSLRAPLGRPVQVNVGVGSGAAAAVASASPQEMVAAIFQELEASGVPRNRITPDMVERLLTGESPAIEVEAIEAGPS